MSIAAIRFRTTGDAIKRLWAETGDRTLSINVEAGMFQIVRVIRTKGYRCRVEPVSEPVPFDRILREVDEVIADYVADGIDAEAERCRG